MYFNDVFRGKRVLITGHTGFKGSWLSLWLRKLGAEVSGYALEIPTAPSHFDATGLTSLVNDHRGDIRDIESLKKVFDEVQPEVVFHLAANAIVRDCYDDPSIAFQTNLNGTINVLECLKKSQNTKAAVLITSDKCYENVEWHYGYRETDQLGGADPYSASKACAEIAISTYFRSYLNKTNCKMASARAGNVIGGGDWANHRIVADCVRSWSKGEALSIRSPQATRPWQHVLEPLSGYLRLAQSLLSDETESNGESYNFGPNAEVVQPVVDLIDELQKSWPEGKYEVTADQETAQKKEANLLKLCCDKALAELEWKAVLDFKETANATMGWYANYYKDQKNPIDFTLGQIEWYETLAKEKNLSWTQ